MNECSSFSTNQAVDSNLDISNMTTIASADPNTVTQTSRKELDLEDLLQENSESTDSKKVKQKIQFIEQKDPKDKVNMEVTIEYIKNLKKLYGPKADNAYCRDGSFASKKSESLIRSRGNLQSRRTIGFQIPY